MNDKGDDLITYLSGTADEGTCGVDEDADSLAVIILDL